MHQAARDDIGPKLVRAARRDNLSGWVNYKSRPGDSHLEHRDERPGSNYGKVSYSYLTENCGPPDAAVMNRGIRCSHDGNSLPPQPARWLQRGFTRRAKPRSRLPSPFLAKRLALICQLTLSACLMRCSNSRTRLSFRRRTAA